MRRRRRRRMTACLSGIFETPRQSRGSGKELIEQNREVRRPSGQRVAVEQVEAIDGRIDDRLGGIESEAESIDSGSS